MKSVKILHTADIHIGARESFLGANADKRRFETLMTFERIMDLAAKEDVGLVAVAGDLFDSNGIEETFIKSVFDKISSYPQIKVVFSAGNHDPLNAESPFLNRELPENLYVLGTKDECITLEELKLRVYGRSFERNCLKGEEFFTLKTDPEYINLLVQHGDLKSDLNSEYNAITPQFVKNSGMDYIALGHLHKRTEIGRIDNTFFAYCGCPEGQGFDELDDKGVYIGEIGKGVCSLSFISVSKRKHIEKTVDISDAQNTADIAELVLSSLKSDYGDGFGENLYKIILSGEISEQTEINLSQITSRLEEKLYFVKLRDNTEYKIDYAQLAKEPTLMGVFVKRMLEKEKNASEEEKQILKKALKLGLRAFKAEVKFDED